MRRNRRRQSPRKPRDIEVSDEFLGPIMILARPGMYPHTITDPDGESLNDVVDGVPVKLTTIIEGFIIEVSEEVDVTLDQADSIKRWGLMGLMQNGRVPSLWKDFINKKEAQFAMSFSVGL